MQYLCEIWTGELNCCKSELHSVYCLKLDEFLLVFHMLSVTRILNFKLLNHGINQFTSYLYFKVSRIVALNMSVIPKWKQAGTNCTRDKNVSLDHSTSIWFNLKIANRNSVQIMVFSYFRSIHLLLFKCKLSSK